MKVWKLKKLVKEEVASFLKNNAKITITDADDSHLTGFIELDKSEPVYFDAEYDLYSERIEHDPGGHRGSQYYPPAYGGYTFEFNNLELNFYESDKESVRTDNNKLVGLYEEEILKAADEFLNNKAKTKEYPY